MIICDLFHNHDPTIKRRSSSLTKKAMTTEILETIEQQSKTSATFSQIPTSIRLQNKECILKKRHLQCPIDYLLQSF